MDHGLVIGPLTDWAHFHNVNTRLICYSELNCAAKFPTSYFLHFRLSHNIAGITIMALGNGAPDLFSSFASVSQSRPGILKYSRIESWASREKWGGGGATGAFPPLDFNNAYFKGYF